MDKEQMWDEIERLNIELRKWQNAAIESETDRNIIYGQLQDAKAKLKVIENIDPLVFEAINSAILAWSERKNAKPKQA